jgi:hypothetical protein
MTSTDASTPELEWRKSSYSVANGNCVEVVAVPGAVMVADTAEPTRHMLRYSSQGWRRFVTAVRGGQFEKSG